MIFLESGECRMSTITQKLRLAALSLVLMLSSTAAIAVTTEQLQKLQQLPPDQQAAILQQAQRSPAIVNAPSSPSSSANVTQTTGDIMKPRAVEIGKLEAAPVGVDEQKAATDAQKAPSTNVPVVEVASQKAADKLETRRSFEDFLREAKPMTVDTEKLQQFGYDLFAGQPTTFEPATNVPVPPEYVLGPGDELKVQLFGKDNKDIILTIDREGSVAFPQVGSIALAGLSFAQAKTMLSEMIAQKMIGNTANITMGQLRSIRIFALGDVFKPGSYTVSGLATLSHALFSSGGVKKMGSLRNIQLKRNGQLVVSLDLYDFLLRGDTSKDRRLLPGDVVFVPPLARTVSIAGEVVRPAIYEVRNEKNVGDIVRMAGGLMPNAYLDRALIERLDGKGEKKIIEVKLTGKGLLASIQNGDVIKIFSGSEFETNQVLLIGNMKRPGTHAWEAGMRVSSVLSSMDDLLPESFMDYGIIEREAPGSREPMLVRFKLADILAHGGKNSDIDLQLHARDKVFVFKRANFREQPKVSIAGSVQNSGDFEFKRNMHLADLVLAAGGLLRDANTDFVEIYRTDPSSKDVSLLRASLARAMAGDAEHDLVLQDFDRVVIHSVYENKTKEEASVLGEVHHSGTYPLGKGMRLTDLLIAAGSVTEFAYLNRAEITRYTVEKGERRVSDHFEVDLAAALRGEQKANIQLQPYDVLTVRRLSNWRPTEQVDILGEVMHPGKYPVEEGERLSSLLSRVGGFTKDAYLPAVVFTRESVRLEQEKQISELARRMEGELAQLEGRNAATDDASLKVQRQKGLESGRRVLAQLLSTKATGRVIIQLDDIEKLKGSEYDVRLRAGDRLIAPKQPDEILVLGEVYSQSAMLFNSRLSRDDYVNQAGVTRMADTDAIYVVHVNGQVDNGSGSGFFSDKGKLGPGDTIVVPPDLQHIDLLDIALDWSRAMMQIGTTIAAGKAIGIYK